MKARIFRFELAIFSFTKKREGLLIQLEDNERASWGEISPLPPYSKESLSDALDQLKKILQKKEVLDLYPSVSFGLESAFLNGISSFSNPLPLSALLMGNPQEILKKAELAKSQGFTSAKLKVKNLSLHDAIDLAKQLKTQFYLRIDANCSWTLDHALEFISHFNKEDFDYFEEPLQNPNELEHFPFPFALDESLPAYLAGDFPALANLKAFVVKPSLHGIAKTQKIQEIANQKKIKLVLSSLFESGIGIYQIAMLGAHLKIDTPLGIDTYSFLENDVLESPLNIADGKIYSSSFKVRKELLTEIPYG